MLTLEILGKSRATLAIHLSIRNLAHIRDRSLLVVDVKDGENCYASHKHRSETLGQPCIYLNPFGLLGLPRVMSTEADYRKVLDAVPSQANGVTLCSGSLGARPDNDLPAIMKQFAPKVHFLHLRNVKRDTSDIAGSFYEAEHLDGDTDMIGVVVRD